MVIIKRILMGLMLIAMVIAVLIAVSHLPGVQGYANATLVDYLSKLLHCRVSNQELNFNLFTGRLRLTGFSLQPEDPSMENILIVDDCDVDLSFTELIRGRITISGIRMIHPHFRFSQDDAGQFVFPFKIPESPQASAPVPDFQLPEVRIRHFLLTDGSIEFRPPDIEAGYAVKGLQIDVWDADLSRLTGSITASLRELQLGNSLNIRGENPVTVQYSCLDGKTGTLMVSIQAPGGNLKLDGSVRDILSNLNYDGTAQIDLELNQIKTWFAGLDDYFGNITGTVQIRGDMSGIPNLVSDLTGTGVGYLTWQCDKVSLQGQLLNGILTGTALHISGFKGQADISAEGRLIPKPDDLKVSVQLNKLGLSSLLQAAKRSESYQGQLSADAVLTLNGWSPEETAVDVNARLEGGKAALGEQSLAADADLKVDWDGSRIRVDRFRLSSKKDLIEIAGSYDVRSEMFRIDSDVAIEDIGALAAMAGKTGRGSLKMSAVGEGSLGDPRIRFTCKPSGLELDGFKMQSAGIAADINGQDLNARLEKLSVNDLNVSMRVEGQIPVWGEAISTDLNVVTTDGSFRGHDYPDLDASIRWDRDVHAKLISEDGQVSGDLDWLENGAGSGKLKLRRLDLSLLSVLDPGLADLQGKLSAEIGIHAVPGQTAPTVDAMIDVLEGSLHGKGTQLLQPVQVTYKDGVIRWGELKLRSDDSTHLESSGWLRQDLGDMGVVVNGEIPDLNAWREVSGVELSGSAGFELTAEGRVERPMIGGTLRIDDLVVENLHVRQIRGVFSPVAPLRFTDMTFRIGGLERDSVMLDESSVKVQMGEDKLSVQGDIFSGQLVVNAVYPLDGSGSAAGEVLLKKLDIGKIGKMFTSGEVPEGWMTGGVHFEVPQDYQKMTARMLISDMVCRWNKQECRAVKPLDIEISEGNLVVRMLNFEGKGIDLKASGALDLGWRDIQGDQTGLKASFGFDSRNLLPFIEDLDRLEGLVTGEINLFGTVAAPQVSGWIGMKNGLVDGASFPVAIQTINGKCLVDSKLIRIDELTARVGDGRVVITGNAEHEMMVPQNLDFRLDANNVDLNIGSDLEMTGDANLALKGKWPKLKLSGEIRLDETLYSPEIEFLEILRQLARQSIDVQRSQVLDQGQGVEVALDVAVQASENIRIENSQIGLDLGAKLQVIGNQTLPGVLGIVNLKSGFLSVLRTDFEVKRGAISFSDPWNLDPDLDIEADTVIAGEKIHLRVTGTASNAQLNLSSDGRLSQAEILKLLAGIGIADQGETKGSFADSAKQYAAEGLAVALADVISSRVDLIVIPFPVVIEGEKILFAVGKRLGDRLTIMYYKSSASDLGDAYEITMDLTQQINVKARQNQDGTISGGIRYRYQFN